MVELITDPKKGITIHIGTTLKELQDSNCMYGHFEHLGEIYLYEYGEAARLYLAEVNGIIQVVGWDNRKDTYKINTGEKLANAPSFTLGSSMDDVIKACGTPCLYSPLYCQDPYTCMYSHTREVQDFVYNDGSSVRFDKNFKVIEWGNAGCLKVSYGTIKEFASPIKLGSTLQDVLDNFGTPRGFAIDLYNKARRNISYSDCGFSIDENGKVIGWINSGSKKINMGTADPQAPKIDRGSSMEDVIKAMGTPEKVENNITWYYGSSVVRFDENWKVIDYNNTGNLKAH